MVLLVSSCVIVAYLVVTCDLNVTAVCERGSCVQRSHVHLCLYVC